LKRSLVMERKKKQSADIAVIFDLDGVIVDNMGYHRKAWELFLDKYAPRIDLESFSRHFGKSNRELMAKVFEREISEEEGLRLGEEKEAIYRRIYSSHILPLPGLMSLLRRLKGEGIRTAVASAAPKINVDFVLDGIGCRQYFDVVLDVSCSPKGKPDPGIYLETAGSLGVPPHRCLVFEDSLPGVKAAAAAGMTVIGVTTSYDEKALRDSRAVIRDFREMDVETIRRCLKNDAVSEPGY
jgi:beta-phosphoglucomutase